MQVFLFRKKSCYTGLIILLSLLAFVLGGCNDQPTPTTVPDPTATPALTVTADSPTAEAVQNNPTALPVPTQNDEYDPNVAYTPGTTVSAVTAGTPRPRSSVTPTPTPNYGTLPVPPRTLVPRPVTVTPGTSRSPLPKGNFVVATANGLYLLSANGQEDRTLANGTAFSNPKISPDGTRIAVLRTDNISLKQQLVLIEFGGDTRTVSTEGGAVLNYSWSPDSKTLALTRANDSNNDGLTDENDKANIWLYDIATTKQQQVAEGRNPTWSPDGVRLAFIIPGPASNPNEIDPSTHKPAKTPNAIGVYNVQNKASRNLLSAKGLEFALKEVSDEPTLKASSVTLRYFKEVSWYPDSKRITVSADATGPNNLRTGLIMTLTIDETNPRLVTAGGDAVLRPLWSPDGKRLAFETEPQYPLKANKNGFAIGLLDNADPVKAVPTRQFVGDPATRNYARAPLWINGGQQLAFIMSDNAILSVVDADGKNERNLISGCSGFDWY